MTSALCSRTRLVCYHPGLHALVHRVTGSRTFSAAGSSGSDEPHLAVTPTDMGLRTVWPDDSMGPFGPQDQRFQLPGNAGFHCHLEGVSQQDGSVSTRRTGPDLLTTPSSSDRHHFILAQFMGEVLGQDDAASSQSAATPQQYFNSSTVECAVQSCPELLKKDFQSMFPEAPSSSLLVVTVTQKSRSDMTAWSAEVEQEREQLLAQFVEGAQQICLALQSQGFWADFIEPSSGLAFFGPYTNSSLFETDERYRLLGFHIEDLGCCRVIRHNVWGTHAFVGTICTDAPPSAALMQRLQGA